MFRSGYVTFWASWIRILETTKQNIKNELDFYSCFTFIKLIKFNVNVNGTRE